MQTQPNTYIHAQWWTEHPTKKTQNLMHSDCTHIKRQSHVLFELLRGTNGYWVRGYQSSTENREVYPGGRLQRRIEVAGGLLFSLYGLLWICRRINTTAGLLTGHWRTASLISSGRDPSGIPSYMHIRVVKCWKSSPTDCEQNQLDISVIADLFLVIRYTCLQSHYLKIN